MTEACDLPAHLHVGLDLQVLVFLFRVRDSAELTL
jgi:hypothetical protein